MHMHIHTASRATATWRWHYCSCRTEFNVIKTYLLRCTHCIYSVRITLHSGLQLHRFVFPLENCIQGSPFFGCLEMMFWRDLVSKRDILRPWCRSTRRAWGCFLALGLNVPTGKSPCLSSPFLKFKLVTKNSGSGPLRHWQKVARIESHYFR